MVFFRVSAIFLILASCMFLVNAQLSITNYYDGRYEILEPRTLHNMINTTGNFTDFEFCWSGYQVPNAIQIQTQFVNGTIIDRNPILLSARVSYSGVTEKTLTIVPGTTTTTKRLYTLSELRISSQPKILFTAILRVPHSILRCFDILLSVSIRMDRTLNPTVFAPLPPLTLPRARVCRSCFSYAGILMATHGQSLGNCGGRTCTCNDGVLTCTGCKRRMAWHRLSDSAKKKYIAAANWANAQNSTALGTYMGTATPRTYYDLVDRHRSMSAVPNIHNNCLFLPWHRLYICEYEHLLQLYDVCVTVPFWYHPIDSTSGVQYHVLNDLYMGDEISPFGILRSPWNVPPTFPSFTRGGSNNNLPLANVNDITTLLTTPSGNYPLFNTRVAGGLHHGNAHVRVGGLMGNILYASADPFFFLHHNMIDRNWQLWRDQGNQAAYDNACSTAATIPPWTVTAQNVLDESGLMGSSATIYRGTGQLPTGNHCKVCYSPVCTRVIGTQVIGETFCLINLEHVLVNKFPIAELNVRASGDSRIQALLQVNNVTEAALVKLAQDNCQFRMPTLEVFDKYSFVTPSMAKLEYCDLILKTPVDPAASLKLSSYTNSSQGDVCDGTAQALGHTLLITEDVYSKRMSNTCEFRVPEDFGIIDFPKHLTDL